jgi:hypothetical protein
MNDIRSQLSAFTDTQLIAVFEAARIGLIQMDIADSVSERFGMSEPDINHLQNKCHELMMKHKPNRVTKYWCDSCANPIEVGNEFFYCDIPCDIASAKKGESATICRKCNERIEADYYNHKFRTTDMG